MTTNAFSSAFTSPHSLNFTMNTNAVSGIYTLSQSINVTRAELSTLRAQYLHWTDEPADPAYYVALPAARDYGVPVAIRIQEAKAAYETIDAFKNLEEDWDGYGAAAISEQTRSNATQFIAILEASVGGLSIPEPTPTPSGTVSLEWQAEGCEAYIEIGNTRYSGFITTGHQQTILLEGRADSIDHNLVELIHNEITAHVMSSVPVTEIRTQNTRYDRLAA